MPVTLKNGTTYRVTFSYDEATQSARGLDQTLCLIETEHKGGWTGLAIRHPGDTQDRRIGRKVALRKALENAGFDRETRTQIWNSLNLRHP